MYFLTEYFLGKYNTVWDKASAYIKKGFDCEPIYNEELLEINIKSHGDKVTDFFDKRFLRWTLIILA